MRADPRGPLQLRCRKQTVANKFNGFVVNFIVGRFCQLSQQVYNKHFNFIGVQKAEQDWTDDSDHFMQTLDKVVLVLLQMLPNLLAIRQRS